MRGTTPKTEPDTVETFMRMCHDAGLKVTHQRLEIFRELVRADDHPSAEDLHARVRKRMPVVSLDTVYRTLAAFERCGVARKLPVAGAARFDGRPDDHQHVVCRRCKKITDLHWPAAARLRPPAALGKWGRIEGRYLHFVGLCNDCLREERRRR